MSEKSGKTRKDAEKEKTYTISEMAREFGVTPRTIRYYEEIGLLSPHRNTPTSHRLYDARDRTRLKLILRGKRFGYSLSELADILDLYEADPTQAKQLVRTLEYGLRHIQEIDKKIQELEELRGEMMEFATGYLEMLAALEEDHQDEQTRYFIAGARDVLDLMQRPKGGNDDAAGQE